MVAVRLYGRKVDANQAQIVKELRQAGFSVETGHDDLLVGFANITLWVEVKNPKGRNRLQESQEKLYEEFKGAYLVARSTEEIINWFSKQI